MPGTLARPLAAASSWLRDGLLISRRIERSTRASSRRQSLAKPSMTRTMRGDKTSGGVARMRGNSARKNRRPCRTASAALEQEGAGFD